MAEPAACSPFVPAYRVDMDVDDNEVRPLRLNVTRFGRALDGLDAQLTHSGQRTFPDLLEARVGDNALIDELRDRRRDALFPVTNPLTEAQVLRVAT
jgi:hypothetical protein